MSTGKLVVLVVAVGLAFGAIGAALADGREADGGPPVQLAGDVDVRKNDADDEVRVIDDDDEGDGDDTRGDDGTSGGNNTGEGDDTRGNDGTNGTLATSTGASNPSQAAVLVEGRTAAQWMASARLYKERWLDMKKANHRHAQQVRNLRASQVSHSPSPRVARGGGTGGGGTSSGGGSGGGDT